jgi:Flp pilus assembly pilin Flp
VTSLTRFYTWYNNVSSESVAAVLRLRRVLTAGQGLAEYALILALIAIVAIIALIFLGGQVSKILSTVGKSV